MIEDRSGATSRPSSNTAVPLVSVVIPCFNYGLFVREAVDSVLSQTLTEVEIIVVDGGSTDPHTLEVVDGLSSSQVRVIRQNAPTLVGENRNAGIAQSCGRYVCCLDADDRLCPTYLQKAVKLLESGRYDAVGAGYQVLGDLRQTLINMPDPLLEDLLLGNHMLTCTVFSRTLFDKTEGFVDTGKGAAHVAEDWRLWVYMAAIGGRLHNIQEPLLEYRLHNQASLSRQPGVPPPWKQAEAIRQALAQVLGVKL